MGKARAKALRKQLRASVEGDAETGAQLIAQHSGKKLLRTWKRMVVVDKRREQKRHETDA